MTRKSLRRWRTWWSLWSFVRIQENASDRDSNIFRAAFAPEGQTHCKVVCALREDAEKTPEVGVDGKDFKCAGNVSLG